MHDKSGCCNSSGSSVQGGNECVKGTSGAPHMARQEQPQQALDFECPCCTDLLLEPVVAPCGHDMCKACYSKWCKASPAGFPACPLCRAPMPTSLGVCVRLKRTVESLHPAESKRRRVEYETSCSAASSACCSTGSGDSHQCTAQPPNVTQTQAWHTQQLRDFAQFQQLMGLAGTYAQYHEYWAALQQQSLGTRTSHRSAAPNGAAAAAAVGMPVADAVLSSLQQQQLQWHMRILPNGMTHVVSSMATAPAAAAAAAAMNSAATARTQADLTHPQSSITSSAHSFAIPSNTQPHTAAAAAATPDPTQAAATAAAAPRWQSVTDVPIRLACARRILSLLRRPNPSLRARAPTLPPSWTPFAASQVSDNHLNQLHASFAAATGLASSDVSGGGFAEGVEPAVLAAVRAVEVHLYRQAESRAVYVDASTLHARVAAYVRSRLGSRAAAAAAAAAAAGTGVEGLPRGLQLRPVHVSGVAVRAEVTSPAPTPVAA